MLFPLDGAHGTKEMNNRVGAGVASGEHTAPGPDGKPDGSYEFLGTVNSYIEFPNGGDLDVKNSMTMLCWLYPGDQDGPLFNYENSGSWEYICGWLRVFFSFNLLKETTCRHST